MAILSLIAIDWNDVKTARRLQDNDVVTATFTDIANPNAIEFVLEMAPQRDFWKGLEVLDNGDARIGMLEVAGKKSKPVGPLVVPAIDVEVGGHLVLWKGKIFNIHTPMYILSDLEQAKGKRVTFRWSSD